MADTHTGRCYCGAVEIEVRDDPLEMGYCHCENCRRYSAAPVSAFTLWKKENVNVTKGAEFLGNFKSSDISERRFCTKCGGHIMVEHPTLGLIDVRLGALRNFPFKPAVHLNYAETGETLSDYQRALGFRSRTRIFQRNRSAVSVRCLLVAASCGLQFLSHKLLISTNQGKMLLFCY